MRPMAPDALADLATRQYGVVTAGQAAACGLTRHDFGARVTAGDLVASELAEHVFEWSGSPALATHRFPRAWALWVAWLPAVPTDDRHLPDAGVLSHTTALRLYQVVGDLPGPPFELTVPTGRGGPGVHVLPLGPDEWAQREGLPLTTPARTFVDIATSGYVDVVDLALVAQRLTDGGLTTRDALVEAFRRHPLAGALQRASADVVDALLDPRGDAA